MYFSYVFERNLHSSNIGRFWNSYSLLHFFRGIIKWTTMCSTNLQFNKWKFVFPRPFSDFLVWPGRIFKPWAVKYVQHLRLYNGVVESFIILPNDCEVHCIVFVCNKVLQTIECRDFHHDDPKSYATGKWKLVWGLICLYGDKKSHSSKSVMKMFVASLCTSI